MRRNADEQREYRRTHPEYMKNENKRKVEAYRLKQLKLTVDKMTTREIAS